MLKRAFFGSPVLKPVVKREPGPDSPPLVRREKLDPSKQRFYFNINKIYADGTEYSFEELMMRKYMVIKEKADAEDRSQKLERELMELRAEVKLLRESKSLRSGQKTVSKCQKCNQSVVSPRSSYKNIENQLTAASVSGNHSTGGISKNGHLMDPDITDLHGLTPSPETTASETTTGSKQTDEKVSEDMEALSLVREMWNGTFAPTEPIEMTNITSNNRFSGPNNSCSIMQPAAVAKKPDFEIFTEDTTANIPVVEKKSTGAGGKPFEIYIEDDDHHGTSKSSSKSNPQAASRKALEPKAPAISKRPVAPSRRAKVMPVVTAPVVAPAAPAKFEIFQDVTTGNIPVVDEELQEPEVNSKRVNRYSDFDFSIHPVSQHRMSNICDLDSVTFMLPNSETEFINRNQMIASTPAPIASKKHVPRLIPKTSSSESSDVTAMNNLGGGQTGKLETIVETSREYKSSSSSSASSAATTTRCTGMSSVQTSLGFHQMTYNNKSDRIRCLSGSDIKDPFDPKLITILMEEMDEPIERRRGFFYYPQKNLPRLTKDSLIHLGNDQFILGKLLDEGAYAKIYTAQMIDPDPSSDVSSGDMKSSHNSNSAIKITGDEKWYALKISKPPHVWEFYICDELHKRLSRIQSDLDIELSVMKAEPAVLFKDGSVLVDELCEKGTLIKVINDLRTKNRNLTKGVIAFWALELLMVIRKIHSVGIIHADIKPDNLLILSFPLEEETRALCKRTLCLKLIDFGRGIDMKLFPDGATFSRKVLTKGSECPEMIDNKNWSYQTDWFGSLDCIHTMIFGEYIKISKDARDNWTINKKFNSRLHLMDIWEPLFDGLLNIDPDSDDVSCPNIVDVTIERLTEWVKGHLAEVASDALKLEIAL